MVLICKSDDLIINDVDTFNHNNWNLYLPIQFTLQHKCLTLIDDSRRAWTILVLNSEQRLFPLPKIPHTILMSTLYGFVIPPHCRRIKQWPMTVLVYEIATVVCYCYVTIEFCRRICALWRHLHILDEITCKTNKY